MSQETSEEDEIKYKACYCEENIWNLIQHPKLSGRKVNVCIISNSTKSVAIWTQKASKKEDGLVIWDYHVIAFAEPQNTPQNSNNNSSQSNEKQQKNAHKMDKSWEVFDLDTILGYPTSISNYFRYSFPYLNSSKFPPEYIATLRILSKENFLALFSSDRSHMRVKKSNSDNNNDYNDNSNAINDEDDDKITHNNDNNNDNNEKNEKNDINNEEEDKEWLSPPPSWPLIYNPQLGHNLFTHFINMNNKSAEYGTIVNVYSFHSLLS